MLLYGDLYAHHIYKHLYFVIYQIYVCFTTLWLPLGQMWPRGRQLTRPGSGALQCQTNVKLLAPLLLSHAFSWQQ